MVMRRSLWSAPAAAAAVLVACGSSQQAGGKDASAILPDAGGGNVKGDANGVGDADSGGVKNIVADASDAAPLPSMQTTCSVPLQPVNSSQPTTTVGLNGIPCNEQALRDAVSKGGIIKFYCPGAMSTIPITQAIDLPIDKDTTIDGGNVVALDGGGKPDAGTGTRIFSFNSSNYRANGATFTLQHIDLLNGYATGTPIPTCPQATNTDGGGGAVFIRDGKLHVFDVTFTTNQAARLGPAVGGGAIYAEGSLEVIVVKSNFLGNSASNGGAIGSLDSDLTLVNDVFSNNVAKGSGANGDAGSCTVDGGQVGNGGNGGAVAIDGASDGKLTICGCTLDHNSAGALGGGLSRTADNMTQDVSIDQSWFDNDTAAQGGGGMYIHNCNLNISASTLSQNSAPSAGGIQADNTKINFVNDTFWDNSATTGIGGAMDLSSNGGTIQSCTFAENHADHVTGGFAAGIAGAMVTINDTIFWRNQTMDCMNPMTCQNTGNTGQANMQTPAMHLICTDPDPPCTASGTTFADAMLSPIKNNGGPTRTMLPMMGSMAIGAGMGCPMTDQRGVARNPGGCTIGAVEVP